MNDFDKLWMAEYRQYWNDRKALQKELCKLIEERDNIRYSGLVESDWEQELDYVILQISIRLQELTPAPEIKVAKAAPVKAVRYRKSQGRPVRWGKIFIPLATLVAVVVFAKFIPVILLVLVMGKILLGKGRF